MNTEELEGAIHSHLAKRPASERSGTGTIYVKVVLAEPSPGTRERHGELFLSMPYFAADRAMLDSAHAWIRQGFERQEILSGQLARAELSEQPGKPYGHEDEEAGGRLLTLPVPLAVEPRE